MSVTVSKVRVHQSGNANENAAGWTDITVNPPKKINLLDYNDPTQNNFALWTIGETSLGAGHYTQVRLVLVPNSGGSPLANSIVRSGNAAEIPLDTPSAVQSGIKLIHQFDVPSGQRVDLLLDFDACKSIVQTGNGTYKLKPVIKVIPFVLNGIEGFVAEDLLASNVVITAQVNGEVVRATVPNTSAVPNPNRGKFLLARLAPGANYDVVVAADNRATKVISGVPVPTASGFTSVSTSGAPLTLNGSTTREIGGVVTLNPADEDGTVTVAAKQSLSSGPVVTVKAQIAALKTDTAIIGDYSYNLILPIARPWLGSYSNTLPITFAEQPVTVGGLYTVRGAAVTETTVYATQTPVPIAVNITAANSTQNFTLTP